MSAELSRAPQKLGHGGGAGITEERLESLERQQGAEATWRPGGPHCPSPNYPVVARFYYSIFQTFVLSMSVQHSRCFQLQLYEI